MAEDEKRVEYIDIDDNEEIGGNSLSSYQPLEDGVYKAHIASIRKIAGTDFDGNPNIQLVFGLKEESTGQVYNFYCNEVLGEKAKLSGFLSKVLGESRKFKKEELLGLPLQLTFKPSKSNPERQVPDTVIKADKSQTRIDVVEDSVPKDVPDGVDIEAEIDKVFGPA